MVQMLSIDIALNELMSQVQPLNQFQEVALEHALGRVTAEDIYAPLSLPPFDCSAMDGYAFRYSDFTEPHPEFNVVGTSLAGKPYVGPIPTGSAIRIFTGALVPPECDTVVLQEDTLKKGENVCLTEPAVQGSHIRHTGHDVETGARLLTRGTKLSPFETSWLAACGVERVQVSVPIRVAVFSTGDELQSPGKSLGPGQIYDSNRTALKHLLGHNRVEINDLGCLADQPEDIRATLKRAAEEADVIITSGGVSVGDADFVRPVIEEMGELTFWNVALKPGKPIAVARIGQCWFFGLPGNPVSTLVTYLLFVAPVIDQLAGAQTSSPLKLRARLSNAIKHKKGRREFLRGVLREANDELWVSTQQDQSSNRLATFANANALVVISEDLDDVEAGEWTQVLLLPRESSHILTSIS